MARSQSRSTSRSRKATSKSPARSKKASPTKSASKKRAPSKSPARSRSTSRGRAAKATPAAAKTPAKTPVKTPAKPQQKTPLKASASSPARTPAKATPAPRTASRSTSRPRVQSAQKVTPRQSLPTPNQSQSTRISRINALGEPSPLNDLRQRIQRVNEAKLFSVPTSSPQRSPIRSSGSKLTLSPAKKSWCPFSCGNFQTSCRSVCDYVKYNSRDIIVSLALFVLIGFIIYFILHSDPSKARASLERFPGQVQTWWKATVLPKIKFW